jgi:cystathionine beta-lyase/cystathionine gamma-synthase
MSSKNNSGKSNKVVHDSFETLLIHAGEKPDPIHGAVAPVLVRSKTFAQKDFGGDPEYQYSRGKNPTRAQLEEKLAALEGSPLGLATVYGSGVAAVAALFFTLAPGDHVLCCREVYGGTYRLLDKLLSRYGITFDFVDFGDENKIRAGIRPTTKYLWIETPTNPSLHVIDLDLVHRISKETSVPYVVDATFSPPVTTQHFEYDADVIIHSLSKYIAGHNDILGGAIITRNAALHEQLKFLQRTLGAVLSPDECYRVLQGVKTLSLRWARVSQTAQTVAEFLVKHPSVKKVFYPGLPSHPGHALAKKQHKNGFGGVVSFELKATSFEELKKFVDTVRANSHIIYGESLASPESILSYPPLMAHKSVPKDVRESLGISDSFFRFSVGFENPEDIIRGLKAGLDNKKSPYFA